MNYYEKTRELEDFFLVRPTPLHTYDHEAGIERLLKDLCKLEEAPLLWEGDQA